MQTQVPVVEDLFHLDGETVELLGSRCTGCGHHWFPRALDCCNPDCTEPNVLEARFGRAGVLWSWTVQHYRPPAPYRAADWQPYAIGLVELPEGLRVLATLTGVAPGQIPIGAELRLTTVRLHDEAVTYAYEPVGESRA